MRPASRYIPSMVPVYFMAYLTNCVYIAVNFGDRWVARDLDPDTKFSTGAKFAFACTGTILNLVVLIHSQLYIVNLGTGRRRRGSRFALS